MPWPESCTSGTIAPVSSHLPEQQSEPKLQVSLRPRQERQVCVEEEHWLPVQQSELEAQVRLLPEGMQEWQVAWLSFVPCAQ